jgi:hypothetical protein
VDLFAFSKVSEETDSRAAGEAVATAVKAAFGAEPLKAVIVYATINHDHADVLDGIRAIVGPDVLVAGCSAQGVMSLGSVLEGGFVVGAMGLGGDALKAATAIEHEVKVDGDKKGRRLAEAVTSQLGQAPDLFLLVYDPLAGADVERLLSGIRSAISCPVVGGAASQPSGPVVKTYQYYGTEAVTHAAVAVGLCGPFRTELGFCHGTAPTGVAMTLTRADGNTLFEFDGRPALDVFREAIGSSPDEGINQSQTAAVALAVEKKVNVDGLEKSVSVIRAAFGFSENNKAIVVQAAIPQGSTIQLHHRTVEVVTQGTVAMGKELEGRLAGKKAWAVLGFECGARTAPFLGQAATLQENIALQDTVAPHAPWLGLLAWGEVASLSGVPTVHNYTYPLVVLTE